MGSKNREEPKKVKEETEMSEAETKMWSVPHFPTKLRNRFVGRCKINGRTVVEVLCEIVTKWCDKEERKEHKEHDNANDDQTATV